MQEHISFCLLRQSNLSRVLTIATEICQAAPLAPPFGALEDFVAVRMKQHCNGSKLEHFSARQVALDVCVYAGQGLDASVGRAPLSRSRSIFSHHTLKALGFGMQAKSQCVPVLNSNLWNLWEAAACSLRQQTTDWSWKSSWPRLVSCSCPSGTAA